MSTYESQQAARKYLREKETTAKIMKLISMGYKKQAEPPKVVFEQHKRKTALVPEHRDGSLQSTGKQYLSVSNQKDSYDVNQAAIHTYQEQWQIYNSLEEVCVSLKQITSMAQSIEDAIRFSPHAKTTYNDALSLLTLLLSNSYEELDRLVIQGTDQLTLEERRADDHLGGK